MLDYLAVLIGVQDELRRVSSSNEEVNDELLAIAILSVTVCAVRYQALSWWIHEVGVLLTALFDLQRCFTSLISYSVDHTSYWR